MVELASAGGIGNAVAATEVSARQIGGLGLIPSPHLELSTTTKTTATNPKTATATAAEKTTTTTTTTTITTMTTPSSFKHMKTTSLELIQQTVKRPAHTTKTRKPDERKHKRSTIQTDKT
jgi:hypothetical protein